MKHRNPALADTAPAEALNMMKEQFRSYSKLEQPFDQTLKKTETVIDWWKRHQKEAPILSVSHHFNVLVSLALI
jgi:predicted NAD/FAD-binding protein